MRTQETHPRHAVLLIRTQHILQIAKRRTFQCRLAALLLRAFAPRLRCRRLPALLPQRGLEKTSLCVAETILPALLRRRSIEQKLLQLFDGARVDHCDFPIAQTRVALPRENESLN